jgi:DNA-binding response OmpR family regulator
LSGSTPQGTGLRILVVEDDDAVCKSLLALLEIEGYEVRCAASATDGIEELQRNVFDLVITDYNLPNGTGSWMVREARKSGRLEGTPVILMTGHPDPDVAADVSLFRKPFDLDTFLRRVHELLGPAREQELARARKQMETSHVTEAATESRAEFVLYISAASPSSLKAVKNMQRLLSTYDGRQVKFIIRDLSREGFEAAEEDRIAFTPTLVQRRPTPRVWIIGDLENTQVVEDLLSVAGVSRRP